MEERCFPEVRGCSVIHVLNAKDFFKNSKQENLHIQLKSELLETEKKYVLDLEEAIQWMKQPK